jgi:PKD repeat protein
LNYRPTYDNTEAVNNTITIEGVEYTYFPPISATAYVTVSNDESNSMMMKKILP